MTSEQEKRSNCVECNASLASNSLYCTSCGASQTQVSGEATAEGTVAQNVPPSSSGDSPEQYRRYDYDSLREESSSQEEVGTTVSGTAELVAEPCKRVSAFALDFILVNVIAFAITTVVFIISSINQLRLISENFTENPEVNDFSSGVATIFGVTVAITILLQITYFGMLNAKNRQTLFKKLFGIRAVDMQGGGLDYGKSFIRAFLTYVGMLIIVLSIYIGTSTGTQTGAFFGVGILIMLVDALTSVFRKDRSTLHDLLSHTQVVTKVK